MAFKMKGPSLYSSSPMKFDNTGSNKAKDGTRQPSRPVTDTVKEGTRNVNIPVNPKAPKVKVPKNNTSIKGKTQFEVDTQGVRNVIGQAINSRKQNIKKVKEKVSKVKDYFTKR